MTITIKWFPPSRIQIKTEDTIIYIDPAYLRTYFTKHPHKIEFSKWLDSGSPLGCGRNDEIKCQVNSSKKFFNYLLDYCPFFSQKDMVSPS